MWTPKLKKRPHGAAKFQIRPSPTGRKSHRIQTTAIKQISGLSQILAGITTQYFRNISRRYFLSTVEARTVENDRGLFYRRAYRTNWSDGLECCWSARLHALLRETEEILTQIGLEPWIPGIHVRGSTDWATESDRSLEGVGIFLYMCCTVNKKIQYYTINKHEGESHHSIWLNCCWKFPKGRNDASFPSWQSAALWWHHVSKTWAELLVLSVQKFSVITAIPDESTMNGVKLGQRGVVKPEFW